MEFVEKPVSRGPSFAQFAANVSDWLRSAFYVSDRALTPLAASFIVAALGCSKQAKSMYFY
jgi:hypothetical protein